MACRRCRKSLGNYIGIDEPAIDIVTKTMKIGDELMWRWIELLSFEIGVDEAKALQADVAGGRCNPRDVKLRLARELAARFHGEAAADNAVAGWNAAVRGEGDTAIVAVDRHRGARRRPAHRRAADRRRD